MVFKPHASMLIIAQTMVFVLILTLAVAMWDTLVTNVTFFLVRISTIVQNMDSALDLILAFVMKVSCYVFFIDFLRT